MAQPEREVDTRLEIFRTSKLLRDWTDPDIVPWEESFFSILQDLQFFFRSHRFDIVHAHTQAAVLLASMSIQEHSAPLIASLHETEPERDACGQSRSEFVVGSAPVDLYIVGSRYFKEQALRFGVNEDRIRLVYYGLDLLDIGMNQADAKLELCEQLRWPHDCPIIALVGRFKERKGQKNLLQALLVLRRLRDFRVILAGSCSSASRGYLNELKNFISDHDLGETVHIIEDCPEATMHLLWQGATLVTQPSTVEGLGFTVIEAMAVGRVVLAANVPGIAETITVGETGFLIDTRDPLVYASVLDKLLSEPELMRSVGIKAQQSARAKFAANRMIHETLSVYLEAQQMKISNN